MKATRQNLARVAGVALLTVVVAAVGVDAGSAPRAHAAIVTVNRVATDDADVASDARTTNRGSSWTMKLCTACGGVGGPTKRGVVKFDVSALGGTVQSARLRVWTETTAAGVIEVQETSRDWSESTVTWDNAPVKGADLGQSRGGEPTGWIDIPLLRVGTGAYVLETPGTGLITLATSETATPPTLVVTVDDGGGGTARKNVLLIVTDDQRDWPSTGVMMPKTKTWLVDGGRSFTNANVTTPSCCPSRSSIMSGRYVHNTGVLRQTDGLSFRASTSLQRYLRDAGYFTAMAGKYLNGWELDVKPQYWDRAAVAKGGYYDEIWGIDGVPRQVPDYSTRYIGDRAVEYLTQSEQNDSQPWFIYLATFAPHKPHTPESRYVGASVPAWPKNVAVNDSTSDKPPYLSSLSAIPSTELAAFREAQQRTLYSVDDMVDRVMRHLQSTGELDNTIVIFTSDNGYHWGEHRYVGKFTPYSPSTRVPMLIRWPGRLPGGSTSKNLVANIDIAPTILSAVGLSISDKGFDGRPMVGATPRSRLLLEYWFDPANGPGSPPTWRGTLTATYLYVESEQPGGGLFYEYYDLATDPWQTTNLYRDGNAANDPPVGPLSSTANADQRCARSNCP